MATGHITFIVPDLAGTIGPAVAAGPLFAFLGRLGEALSRIPVRHRKAVLLTVPAAPGRRSNAPLDIKAVLLEPTDREVPIDALLRDQSQRTPAHT